MSKVQSNDARSSNSGTNPLNASIESHPFTRTIRLAIRATTRFSKFLDEKNEKEIERELYWKTSRFLCELKGVCKIGYQPSAELLMIMPEFSRSLEAFKASLNKHYRANKTRRICVEIDKLINEVCDNCRFDDPLLLKDIWMHVSRFLRSLSSRSENAELADKMLGTVEIGTKSVNAIGKAVVNGMEKGKRRKHTLSATAVRSRDSVRDKREDDKQKVIREINRRWRNNEGSRNKIIKKMRIERTWQARMRNFKDSTLERYSKGFKE